MFTARYEVGLKSFIYSFVLKRLIIRSQTCPCATVSITVSCVLAWNRHRPSPPHRLIHDAALLRTLFLRFERKIFVLDKTVAAASVSSVSFSKFFLPHSFSTSWDGFKARRRTKCLDLIGMTWAASCRDHQVSEVEMCRICGMHMKTEIFKA